MLEVHDDNEEVMQAELPRQPREMATVPQRRGEIVDVSQNPALGEVSQDIEIGIGVSQVPKRLLEVSKRQQVVTAVVAPPVQVAVFGASTSHRRTMGREIQDFAGEAGPSKPRPGKRLCLTQLLEMDRYK